MRALLLGTGSAWPIPRPGCTCAQCEEAREDPRARRTRSGLYLAHETAGFGRGFRRVLVDVSVDILAQLEREGLSPDLDAVVLTHHHVDHMLGLHDLAQVRGRACGPLPVFAGPVTEARIRAAFDDLLRPGEEKIELRPWAEGGQLEVGGMRLQGFETSHRSDAPTIGVLLHVSRDGRDLRIAYATDMGAGMSTGTPALQGIDLFLGDGTFFDKEGHGHPSTTRTIEIARGLRARRIALTHVGHWGRTHAEACLRLPADVAICRDGDDLFSFLPAV